MLVLRLLLRSPLTVTLRTAVRRFGAPPSDVAGPGALEELQVCRSYQGDALAVEPVHFDNVDRISLPKAGTAPTALTALGGGEAGQQVVDRLEKMLLFREEGLTRAKEFGPGRVYVDPNLRNPRLYRKVAKRLMDSNPVAFYDSSVCEVGLFFARKKDGRLRMILDGRRSSLLTADPDKVDVASGGAFGGAPGGF